MSPGIAFLYDLLKQRFCILLCQHSHISALHSAIWSHSKPHVLFLLCVGHFWSDTLSSSPKPLQLRCSVKNNSPVNNFSPANRSARFTTKPYPQGVTSMWFFNTLRYGNSTTSGQAVPMPGHPLSEQIFPHIQSKPFLVQLEANTSHPVTCYLREGNDPHLATASF